MAEPKWTPGPWDVEEWRGPLTIPIGATGRAYGVVTRGRQRGTVIAFLRDTPHMPPDEVLANAHLAAASEGLYEALAEMVRAVESHPNDPDIVGRALEFAKTALRKARGESDGD